MNPKVTLVGRLGADPESVGTSGVRLRVVTSDRAKNDKGEWEDRDTSWWTVKAWKTLAEQTKKTLKKGQEVIITGTIYQVAYGNNGIDPTCTVKVKGEQEVCDISRMIEKLNMEHERTKK